MEFSKCEGTGKNKRKQIVKTKFLKFYPKYYFNILQTCKLRQYFMNTTQVTILALVAVQDNAAQQWWYSTILAANTISNTGKFAKMVHPDFFAENGGRSSHHFDLKNQ